MNSRYIRIQILFLRSLNYNFTLKKIFCIRKENYPKTGASESSVDEDSEGTDSDGTGSEGTDSDGTDSEGTDPDPGSSPPKSPEVPGDPAGSSTGVSGAAESADESEMEIPVSVEVPEKVLVPVVSTEAPPSMVTTPSVVLRVGSTGTWAAKFEPNLLPKVVGLGALGFPSHGSPEDPTGPSKPPETPSEFPESG